MRHRAGAPDAHLRAVLQPPPGRHRPGVVPVAELRAALGWRHPRHERAGRRVDLRGRAAAMRRDQAWREPHREAARAPRPHRRRRRRCSAACWRASCSAWASTSPAWRRARPRSSAWRATRRRSSCSICACPTWAVSRCCRRSAERSPATDVIMLTGHGSIDTAIESIRMGAFDYVAKPCPLDELEVRIQRALERQSLRRRATLLERGLTPPDVGNSFLGDSAEFRRVLQLIDRVAPTDSTVLITGETGSGKEMAAKLIHARSPRRGRPFVVVECAALQESLLQSELFGHERGAFTGAESGQARPVRGRARRHHLPRRDRRGQPGDAGEAAARARHVHVPPRRRHRPRSAWTCACSPPRTAICTAMVSQGLFREDLFYRLSTIAVHVPPLRERQGDVDILASHFIGVLNERFGWRKRVAPAAHGRAAAARLARQRARAAPRRRGRDDRVRRPEILPEHLPAGAARSRTAGRTRRTAACPRSRRWSAATSRAPSRPATATAGKPRGCSASASGTCIASSATTGSCSSAAPGADATTFPGCSSGFWQACGSPDASAPVRPSRLRRSGGPHFPCSACADRCNRSPFGRWGWGSGERHGSATYTAPR